ncbi:ABC transporter substrate binding protein [Bradyrhizobium sp. Rc2d]|uniref:ABC transporter substrate binding protein n=1 Tax=Bradyrhizobium sp. Rc2d TaxID=1855321 RepID=UPI001FCD316E|nr:ABC transporter substrate binding protein [Bradyrhizobium sp. Rc2d]
MFGALAWPVAAAVAQGSHKRSVIGFLSPGAQKFTMHHTAPEPYVAGLPAKQMELAREIVPAASTVGLLTNINDPKAPPQVQELEVTGRALEVKLLSADANRPEDLDSALQTLASAHVDVVIVLQTSMLISENARIAQSAFARRLPTVYGYREHVVAGGLVSYGVDLRWCFRRGAYFVDKILHGTPAGDLRLSFRPRSCFRSIFRPRRLSASPSPRLYSPAPTR